MNIESDKETTVREGFRAFASIFWVFGLLVFVLGGVIFWSGGSIAETPNFRELQVYTGEMQRLKYFPQSGQGSAWIDVVIYNEKDYLKRGKIRHAKRKWRETLQPYKKQQVTIFVDSDKQIWRIETGGKAIISESEILRNFSNVSKHELSFGKSMMYIGTIMILSWLFFLRKRYPMGEQ